MFLEWHNMTWTSFTVRAVHSNRFRTPRSIITIMMLYQGRWSWASSERHKCLRRSTNPGIFFLQGSPTTLVGASPTRVMANDWESAPYSKALFFSGIADPDASSSSRRKGKCHALASSPKIQALKSEWVSEHQYVARYFIFLSPPGLSPLLLPSQ